ncbi:MAG: hypothetical protein ACE5NC_02000 [Anaerolineae bacterium]
MAIYHKFSFDFRDPFIEISRYRFGFRIFTPSNTYGIDPSGLTTHSEGDRQVVRAAGLTWAGGQETAPGGVEAQFRASQGGIEWTVRAWGPEPIKAIATLLPSIPLGRIAHYDSAYQDPGEGEHLFYYPHSGRRYGTSISSPLLIIQPPEDGLLFVQSLDRAVRPKRFYLKPRGESFRLELIAEEEARRWAADWTSPPWRIARAETTGEIYRTHHSHLEEAYGLVPWEARADLPDWIKETQLVLSLHGTHWTGYVFNSYAQMLEILRWVSSRIEGRRVLVYLPGWDGRYYWDYPRYEAYDRMGGEEGFRRLIGDGQAMGFRFMPMFSINSSNRYDPRFRQYQEGLAHWPDGQPSWIDFVDWDNDRSVEAWQPLMNIGAPAWRELLLSRIARVVEDYGADAVFLDIAHFWQNDPRWNMYEGTVQLVEALRERFPRLLISGEWYYDALLGLFPLVQGPGDPALYPGGLTRYVRSFGHLSHPAPGLGSTGVHEFGFRGFDAASLKLREDQIPTVTVVDDTFQSHREVLAEIIDRAAERGS